MFKLTRPSGNVDIWPPLRPRLVKALFVANWTSKEPPAGLTVNLVICSEACQTSQCAHFKEISISWRVIVAVSLDVCVNLESKSIPFTYTKPIVYSVTNCDIKKIQRYLFFSYPGCTDTRSQRHKVETRD